MQLEDHAGDIVNKACLMKNLSAAAAASAAGISEGELAAFMSAGRPAGEINFAALAGNLELDAAKLKLIAAGWCPAPKDLSRWRCLRMFTTKDTEMSVNCYLVWDEVTRAAALFDTGMDAQPVLEAIAAEELSLREIFITHSHWDHVEALPQFRKAFPQARLHSGSAQAPADQRLQAGQTVHLGSLRITHRETPGHAVDGVTYVITNWPDAVPAVTVVGDAIFAGSIGRGNQSWDLARRQVKSEILTLSPETLICPGHGPLTTVAEEQQHNPFF